VIWAKFAILWLSVVALILIVDTLLDYSEKLSNRVLLAIGYTMIAVALTGIIATFAGIW